MKVPYVEGVASHNGPESCGGDREVTAEALTGESVGQVLSRENESLRGADDFLKIGRQHVSHRQSQEVAWPRVVRDPVHARKLFVREPGDPTFDPGMMVTGSAQRIPREHGCDARRWEVGQSHRYRGSCRTKAGESPAGGGGGGKGTGRGEFVPTKQVPDTEPEKGLK